MAYTKKVVTEKKTEETADQSVDTETTKDVEEKTEEKVTEKKKRVFKDSDPILCMSITPGQLGMFGLKTNIHYSWVARGDETEVEYQDLVGCFRSG